MHSSSLGPLRTERTLGDTAAVTSCSRRSQYLEVVNCDKLSSSTSICLESSSDTAPIAIGIRQEVEQIRTNVLYSMFLNVILNFL